MDRLRNLEAKKKQLYAMKDKRRTRRMILIGAMVENSLSWPDNENLQDYYADLAKKMYAKKPADLALVLETFEPSP